MDKKDVNRLSWQAWQLLERLCSIPRISREEGEASDMLEAYMRHMGLSPQRHHNNIWCMRADHAPDKPTLLLNAHIDTVKATGWQTDPLRPLIEAEGVCTQKMTALGTNDDGGSLACLLHVFAALPPQAYNLVFLASAEEEVSGKNGIESALPLLPHIDAALVGEPTRMQPAIAEKGLIVIDAVAHGRAGHAARDEGDNAIYRAMRDIRLIENLKLSRKSRLLGDVKMTVTIIKAGTLHNVVPHTCEYTIDVRPTEMYTNQEVMEILHENLESELHARSLRLGSSHIDTRHPLVRRAVEMGLTPFGSPTLSDQALMPFPSMKIGPGDSRRSHTAGEYILMSEIQDGINVYVQLLDKLKI